MAVMGKYGTSDRNKRGDRLIEFAASRNMYITSGKFQKKLSRLWKWRSPGSNIKNEIDFIMTNRPETVKNVTIMNRVNTGSDHRMVRCKLDFQIIIERRKLVRKPIIGINYDELHKRYEFQLKLKNKFECLALEVCRY
jgi:hypothetical protein